MSAQSAEQMPDADVIAPAGTPLVVNGIKARVKPIKTRAFLAMVNVLREGLGAGIRDIRFDVKGGAEAVGSQMVGLLVLALPGAVDEFVYFLGTIVEAVDPDDQTALTLYLHDDPDPAELIDIFEVLAAQEQDNLVALMGKVQAMVRKLGPMYSNKTPKAGGSAKSGPVGRSRSRST